MPEDECVIRLLERHHLLVHPGYFFDFPRDGYLVVSLLTRPDVFRRAIDRLLDGRLHLIGHGSPPHASTTTARP